MESRGWRLRWLVLLTTLAITSADVTDDYSDINDGGLVWGPMGSMSTMGPLFQTSGLVTTADPDPDHQSSICSTWGNFHFKSLDGFFFDLPDTCSYILAAQCSGELSDFNIQMQRDTQNQTISFSSITLQLDGTLITLSHGQISFEEQTVEAPFYQYGIRIEGSSENVKISNKHGVAVFWDKGNSISIELPDKYRGQTCGLCGNFNGNQTDDNNLASWKLATSAQTCDQLVLDPLEECEQAAQDCQDYLSSPAFADCGLVMDMSVFVQACVSDMCQCYGSHDCLCNTLTEISRQCAHAGGNPGTWRSAELCPKSCDGNMTYLECGSPCQSTCTDPNAGLLCKEHCVDGCFCPEGTVEDDVGQGGCITVDECPCQHDGALYESGESYEQACKTCECVAGHWNCLTLECPGMCSVVGGSHVTTYDGQTFTFSGNCDYILTKHSNDSDIAVLGNLAKCDPSRADTCLNSVTLVISGNTVIFYPSGTVTFNGVSQQVLPITSGSVTIFQPSTSFIIAELQGLRLEIQLTPVMQLFIVAETSEKGQLSGLCGNYNDILKDDFRVDVGITEGTATTFVNFWKHPYSCPDLENIYDNPCSLSVDTAALAKDWCSRLTNPNGTFSSCHSEISPDSYYQWCVYDTCKCSDIQKCMCASLSVYAHVCASRGILLDGWMDSEPCDEISACGQHMVYSYSVSSCGGSCRSLAVQDDTCGVPYTPVHGCVCPPNTFLSDDGSCVPATQCPCYTADQVIAPAALIYKDGAQCTCNLGKLQCSSQAACQPPKQMFNCSRFSPGQKGTECQASCQKQDANNCVSTGCVSGCMCPEGLLSDGSGGCVEKSTCPCVHNGVTYSPGDEVQDDCNTCTCTDGTWTCTEETCYSTCTIYGAGHFNTFDGKSFYFHGDCEHTLAHDNCENNSTSTFRLVTENIPCASTNSICSKSIDLSFGGNLIVLSEENGISVVESNTTDYQFEIHSAGIYTVIVIEDVLNLIWDNKTYVMLQLHPDFQGQVCGLCGNFDGNANNDFLMQNGEEVTDAEEFGNSWKVNPSCPDVTDVLDPCDQSPHRRAWATKQCSIITSNVFEDCQSLVDSAPYYEACLSDTCACDSGGDCDCLCTAVGAYAAECRKKGACIAWRRPDFCPLFCDYYNDFSECMWHYKPCGSTCMKTCKNRSGTCSNQIPLLEGCFLQCPSDKPYIREETMKCVPEPECDYCFYDGKLFPVGSIVYNATDGNNACFIAICNENGQIQRSVIYNCRETTTTPFTFSSSTPTTITSISSSTSTETPTTTEITPSSSTATPSTTPVSCGGVGICLWSNWIDSNTPSKLPQGFETESIAKLWSLHEISCDNPEEIQCRAVNYPQKSLAELGQVVYCNTTFGLWCSNEDNADNIPPVCQNYEIKVKCCADMCSTTTTTSTPTPTATPTVTTTSTTVTYTPTTTSTETPTTTETIPSSTVTISPDGRAHV